MKRKKIAIGILVSVMIVIGVVLASSAVVVAAAATGYDEKLSSSAPAPTLTFTDLQPSTITTNESTYDATLMASGSNFYNVSQITFNWGGPDSGSDTWNKGDSSWNTRVTVNSDTSMTLQPVVVYNEHSNSTKTWTWRVTLKDNTGATASRNFTVIYVPATPTLTPTRITNESGNEFEPDQSNDGQYIVMKSNRDGGTYNIWRMNSEGGNFVKVTNMPSSPVYGIQRSAWNPVFHPDGESVYYMDNSPSGADYWWFCRTPTNGTGGREQILLIPGGETGGRLSFSPDGSQFAYHHTSYGQHDIKISNSDGSNLKSFYRNDSSRGDLAWSPDGTLIYFSMMSDDGVISLYSIGIDGQGLTRLTNASLGDCTQPAVSPDGEKIVFRNKKSSESDSELYLMSSDGSNIMELTDNDFEDISPTWSYDGNMIIYSSNADGDYDLYGISLTPTPAPTLTFTDLQPSTITTNESTYDATLTATGSNFYNVSQITFNWSGPDSGSDTWNKGDSSWNTRVTVNSDTSMTLQPVVLYNEHSNSTKTWTWTVTLKDNTGATASRNFTVIYAPATPTPAGVIYVPDNYSTIQQAVDNASAGDTIIVKSGTYHEHVNVTKQLILKGMDTGGGMPIVDADGSGSAITLSADGIALEGFEVINSGGNWRKDAGIKVTSDNNIIKNNIASNNLGQGIRLDSSSNTISNNTASNNHEDGIHLGPSNNNKIYNNTVSNNRDCGICLHSSSNNTIYNNTALNHHEGIYLYSSSNNTIYNNTVNSNNSYGIHYLRHYGIHLYSSNNNKIYNNNVSNHHHEGIYLYSSSNNKIYLNNFINNTDNVYSYISTNIWNSTEKITYTYNSKTYTNYLGNYWSDYTGSDGDGDGIGDTPYGGIDNYPLMERFENYISSVDTSPVVDSFSVTPTNITVGESLTISYSVSDEEGLKRVELWRAKSEEDPGEGSSLWEKVQTQDISGTSYSGSFSDTPPTYGTYWYGIHVVDTVDQWKSERDYGKGPIKVGVFLDVPFFSQLDPAWKDKKLDHSKYSIGTYGCAVTSAAMVLNYSGWDTDPLRLNMTLTAHGGINNDGDITQAGWNFMGLDERVPKEGIGNNETKLLSKVEEELAQNRPVVASVGFGKDELHYIVFRGKIGDNYHFWDPADTKPKDRTWRYGAHGNYTLRTLRLYRGALVASFTYSPYPPYNPVIGESITLDASSSYPEGSITNYKWDFGDGSSIEGADKVRVTHSYSSKGTYKVTLTVTDDKGAKNHVSRVITVKIPPVLLVHGFQSNDYNPEEIWKTMNQSLTDDDFKVYVSHYAFDGVTSLPLNRYAQSLGEEIEGIRKKEEVNKVDIVAHDLGGLVSRWYIELGYGYKNVRKLIMLETPNNGAPAEIVTLFSAGADPKVKSVADSIDSYITWGTLGMPTISEETKAIIMLVKINAIIYSHLGRVIEIRNWDSVAGMSAGLSMPPSITKKVHYVNIVGWLYKIPWAHKVFDLEGVETETLSDLSGYHGELPEHEEVIQKVKNILHDDPGIYEQSLEEKDSGIQYAPSISGKISPDEQKSHEIAISSTSIVDITLAWSKGDLNLTLVTPNGTLIDPYTNDTNISYYSDENLTIEGYTINNPESGIWKVNVTAVNISEEENYTILTFLDTNITISLNLSKYKYEPNEEINIIVNLTHNGEAITNASITTEIKRPDDTIEDIMLYDDGLHEDNQADDSIYANTYKNMSLRGGYDLKVIASGEINGDEFEREELSTVWVEQCPDLTLNASDIHFSNEKPNSGENITINATIHNIGKANASNASIIFYDGEPAIGDKIGEDVINVSANGTANASVSWTASGGIHEIYIFISPYNEFLEDNYTNNLANKTIRVNMPPIASFTYTPQNPFVNETITFNASSSYDPDGFIVNYTWNFGDGNTTNTTEPIITHSYNSAGNYAVNLTVTDNDGMRNSTTKTITISEKIIFDTGAPANPYPSIAGTFNGTITPSCNNITVSKLYTYPCPGTGGHTEYAMIWNTTIGECAVAEWNGYIGDYHNISFNKTLTLEEGVIYNYTIRTGSYPQIIHELPFNATGGTITCDKFIDANGRIYYDWIPAIKLWT